MGGRRRSEACGRGWVAMRARLYLVCVSHGIQLAVGPQPLWLRNHNFGLAQRIMVKRLATLRHDPLGITDSACKNQLVVVSVQYGPFNTYIPIRSTTIGKSRVARDPIAMHTSWRSNSDITSATSIGYPRMRASGESSTTKHRLLHASGPHPIPPPNDPKNGPTVCLWKFGLQCPTCPLLPPRKVPLEDLIYTSCTDPIPQPAAARTPRLHQPSAVTHLFYAYVRKATNIEFNVVVLGRDLAADANS
ncbi:hypothetical protein F511_33533 [Dorcoceras hygrometricum]|uniref:Uncharacterized protein n=1 Tax=Dorcoceras hygrometricum TaxID=472368 RepID=A0A2Z7B1C5_9LAMI|nr:hypothetical protein F511_33533 [Dorcoceras hygrometricum]